MPEKVASKGIADPLKQVESYRTFTVISSLIFGFGVNFWARLHTSPFQDHFIWELLFTALMSLVLVSNAFAMIVMSLTEFYIKRYLADDGMVETAVLYLAMFSGLRYAARLAFYCGLVCFLMAIIMFVQPHLTITDRLVATGIIGLGTVFIAVTAFRMLHPDFKTKYAKRRKRSIEKKVKLRLEAMEHQNIMPDIDEANEMEQRFPKFKEHLSVTLH